MICIQAPSKINGEIFIGIPIEALHRAQWFIEGSVSANVQTNWYSKIHLFDTGQIRFMLEKILPF